MINSHYQSPSFNSLLELLSSLPKYPQTAKLKDIARDLGLTSQEVRTKLDRLASKYRLCLTVEGGYDGATCAVAEQSWAKATEIAGEYWAQLESACA